MKSTHHDPACECEHEDHFDEIIRNGETITRERPKHRYGNRRATESLRAPHGTFHVCADCAATCLAFLKEG